MNASAGYTFRPPTPAEIGAVAAVLAADEVADAGEVVLNEDFLRGEWEGLDLATDAWIATNDKEAIVAYGQVTKDEPNIVESWGVVHPDHRGRGLGSGLLDRIEDRAEALLAGQPVALLRSSINAADDAAAAMLGARGYRVVRHFWHMQIELAGSVEMVPVPAGIDITGVDSDHDLAAVHDVFKEAFADHWGYESEPFEQWRDELAGSSTYDPSLWLLAQDEAKAVGALTGVILGERGWVSELGVLSDYRGRGIAKSLLHHSFASFSHRGIERITLNVDADNTTGATSLYEGVGMHIVKRWDKWERPWKS